MSLPRVVPPTSITSSHLGKPPTHVVEAKSTRNERKNTLYNAEIFFDLNSMLRFVYASR